MKKPISIIAAGLLAVVFFGLSLLQGPSVNKQALAYSDRDRDLMIRTIYGEAVNEPRLGQIAVAWVIRNRLKNPHGWKSIAQIVTFCGYAMRVKLIKGKKRRKRIQICQFEPWMSRGAELLRLKKSSTHYQHIGQLVDDVLGGQTADPTHGAWYFLNEKTVAYRVKKGMTLPTFARHGRCKVVIGRHSFCPRVGKSKLAKK